MSKKKTIIVDAYPDRAAGNDPKLFSFLGGRWGGGGSLSPPRLNIFTVGNMGVMVCLGQGGLHTLSASSFRAMEEQFMWGNERKNREEKKNMMERNKKSYRQYYDDFNKSQQTNNPLSNSSSLIFVDATIAITADQLRDAHIWQESHATGWQQQ